MSKKEKLELTELYTKLKETRSHSGEGEETYTNGYMWGHRNGQVELLEHILKINTGDKCMASDE